MKFSEIWKKILKPVVMMLAGKIVEELAEELAERKAKEALEASASSTVPVPPELSRTERAAKEAK